MKKIRKSSGSSLIEVLVVATILSVVSLTFLGSFAIISRFHEKNMLIIKSELLAEEGMEAIRLIKGANWTTLSNMAENPDPANPNFFTGRYLELASTTWGVTTTPEIVDGMFYRKFGVWTVSRDSNGDIVSTGGTPDSNILKVYVQVEWQWRRSTTSARYYTYMTRI